MTVTQFLEATRFLVDKKGEKQAVVFDYALWERLLELVEDLEDTQEIAYLREANEETVSWEEAKGILKADGIHV